MTPTPVTTSPVVLPPIFSPESMAAGFSIPTDQPALSGWVFNTPPTESRQDLSRRLLAMTSYIPSSPASSSSSTPPAPAGPPKPKFKPKPRSERNSWFGFGSLLTNIKDAFFGDDNDDYEGMTDEKKQELKDARDAGRTNFWKGFVTGIVKAAVITVAVGAAVALTGITLGAAAPVIALVGVGIAAYMTVDAIKKKAEAEDQITEAVITGNTNRLNRVVNQDMGSAGDEFGTGVFGLVAGVWGGLRSVGSRIMPGRVAPPNMQVRTPTPPPPAPTPTPSLTPTPPPTPSAFATRMADVRAATAPTTGTALRSQVPALGIHYLTTPDTAVTNFNERYAVNQNTGGSGTPGTTGPAAYDVVMNT